MSDNDRYGALVPDIAPTSEDTRDAHALTIRADDEGQAILMMDRYDLEQALAELKGDVIEQFVYIVPGRSYTNRAGRKVVIPDKRQLSYAGIKEAARLYKNVAFGANATPVGDGSWMITSWAHNIADNVRVEYPYPYPAFNPADEKQSIDFRATVSKAMRNALAAVLPIAYLTAMIQRWGTVHAGQGGNSGGNSGGNGQEALPAAAPPAAIAAPAAPQKTERARLFERLQELRPGALSLDSISGLIDEVGASIAKVEDKAELTTGYMRTLVAAVEAYDRRRASPPPTTRQVTVIDGAAPDAQNGPAVAGGSARFVALRARLDKASKMAGAKMEEELDAISDEARTACAEGALSDDERETIQRRAVDINQAALADLPF